MDDRATAPGSALEYRRPRHNLESNEFNPNHFLARKLEDFRDWAPIYLSPELIDTEYGSVLNIADQFLKSWSNHGTTRYINFAYPPPARWAFSAPIFKLANTEKGLTYNWNTTSAGASIELGGLDVFWLRRTGALNVSYIAGQDPSSMTPGSNAGLEDWRARGRPGPAAPGAGLAVRAPHRRAQPARRRLGVQRPRDLRPIDPAGILDLDRVMLEDCFGDALRRGPLLELRDGLMTMDDLLATIPPDFRGVLDLSSATPS